MVPLLLSPPRLLSPSSITLQLLDPATWLSLITFFRPRCNCSTLQRYPHGATASSSVRYDFTPFLSRHPGGRELLVNAKNRYEDCTYVFESHHHDYRNARKIIAKYEVSQDVATAIKANLKPRPKDPKVPRSETFVPSLLDDTSFYSVLRRRVDEHLKAVGHADGGPCKSVQHIPPRILEPPSTVFPVLY